MSGHDAIVRSIDEEIDRLQRARALVTATRLVHANWRQDTVDD